MPPSILRPNNFPHLTMFCTIESRRLFVFFMERSLFSLSLRIISGRSGSGKTKFIQQEIVQSVDAAPFGDPIFI